MTTPRALPALLAFATAILVMSGCATPPASEPAPSATPSPSATPVDPVVDPASVFDLECADLLTPGDLEALSLTAPVTPSTGDPLSTLPGGSGPLAFGTQQLGGLHCEWNNGKDYYADWTGSPSDQYAGVLVNALPDATGEWPKYLDNYSQEAGSAGCHDIAATWSCEQNDLVDDVWVRLTVAGVAASSATEASAAVTPLFDRIAATILTPTRIPQPDWVPADTIELDGSCEQFGTPAEITALLGLPSEMVWVRPAGGWSLEASTWSMMQAAPCIIGETSADYSVGVLDWLPAGEWAWRKSDHAGEPADLPSLTADDAAFVHCADGRCTGDLLIGRNWLRVEMSSTEGSLTDFRVEGNLGDATSALLAHIVTKLRG